ncbi:MAG: hypothetical protein AAFN74_24480, partial [Myxococcota bacterium]
ARDVSLLEVALGEDEAVRGIVGGAPSLGLRPDRPLLLQAHAYERQLEAALTELRSELSEELTSEERTQLNTQVAELQTAYAPLRPAIEAYLTALEGSIGRSIKGPRPAIAPPTDGPEPAAAEADALRELLTDAPIMTTDAVRLSASALVLIGQEAHASLDADARELLAARFEVRATAGRLRAWSSQEDVRRAIDALQRYKTALLRSQASASAGSRALFTTEVGRVHQDLSTVTGLSTQDLAGLTEAIALADRVQSHALSPLLLYSVHDLVNPYIRQQAQTNNGGLVALDRRLYRLTGSGDSVTASMVPLNKLSVPRPQRPSPSENTHAGPASVRLVSGAMRNASAPPVGEATLLPFAAPATGNIINFSGRTIEFTNRTVAPTPSGPLSSAVPGDYVIRGASSAWIVAAHPGGPPIAGASIGGEWWRVEANGTWTLEVDAAGGVRREESERRYGGRRGPGGTYGTRLPKSMTEGPNDGSSRGPKAVRGALGIIMIVNEIMGEFARARQQERYNLEMARAQLQFWTIAGANPRWQMRTGAHNEVRSPDTEATTSVFGDTVYHFITDIDVDALQRNLPTVAQNYQQLRLWIDMGEQLRAILVEPPMPKEPTAKDRAAPRRMVALVAGRPGTRQRRYIDLTSVLQTLESRYLEDLDAHMRRRVGTWSDAERNSVFRLRSGAQTPIYRKARGQTVVSATHVLGTSPWVRPIDRASGSIIGSLLGTRPYNDRVKVVPANADTERSALVSSYMFSDDIESVMEDVEEAGRPIRARSRKDGRLESFVAGALPNSRQFDETRYYRHQQHPNLWTVAVGELNEFWVDADQLEPVDRRAVDRYVAGGQDDE